MKPEEEKFIKAIIKFHNSPKKEFDYFEFVEIINMVMREHNLSFQQITKCVDEALSCRRSFNEWIRIVTNQNVETT